MSNRALLLIGIVLAIATARVCADYNGSPFIYLVFTLLANVLLLNGLIKGALFFDTFIGIFFWLGFWLKGSFRIVYDPLSFSDALGFDGSPAAMDKALIVSCVGFSALLVASWLRRLYFNYPVRTPACDATGLFGLYLRHRRKIVFAFFVLTIFVALTNVFFGIYQRGLVAKVELPFGLSGVYKWLLQFGLASIAALIVRFEIQLGKGLTISAAAIPLIEAFLSNTSLLSRGMILNAAGVGSGIVRTLVAMKRWPSWRACASIALFFVSLFAASVLSVNYLRAGAYDASQNKIEPSATTVRDMTTPLFVERWVGIDGVVAVSSYPYLGWDIWNELWREKLKVGQLSVYDQKFINSPYKANLIDPKVHFVSLPGILAFLYLPGSYVFLFAALFASAVFAALLEVTVYYLGGKNWILCSLMAEVIAYRYAHFGYAPAQSYLLFGSVFANVLIIYCLDRFLVFQSRKRGKNNALVTGKVVK